jgi:hypothetical protein
VMTATFPSNFAIAHPLNSSFICLRVRRARPAQVRMWPDGWEYGT